MRVWFIRRFDEVALPFIVGDGAAGNILLYSRNGVERKCDSTKGTKMLIFRAKKSSQ